MECSGQIEQELNEWRANNKLATETSFNAPDSLSKFSLEVGSQLSVSNLAGQSSNKVESPEKEVFNLFFSPPPSSTLQPP